ncbi:putative HNH endonuclease 1 [Bacillus phage BCU4]|uniref:Putative HNH endonuclease 1 n=1 Tax=Bacillus phage BCU4 TaxID=1126951 RepID=J9PRF1_9CAUD|nr:putative HNH endonuclease 1 [Bacillus phage BCU4]AEW47706.1 putative HNH endonuclease 1 [Bacillus phage BCU4]
MDLRNLEKLKPFIEMHEKGEIVYNDGALYRKVKRFNQFKTVKLDEPELMRFDSPRGYWRVSHKGVTCYEHIVIYAIFHGIESMKDFECIDHIDTNKKNNKIYNLEGVTIEENNGRAKEKGLLKSLKGSDNGSSILTEDQVKLIRSTYSTGSYTQREVGKMFNIDQSTVCDIVNKKRWKHVN